MAEINNYSRGNDVYATNEDDVIRNDAGDVYIYGRGGDDSIYSDVSYYQRHLDPSTATTC